MVMTARQAFMKVEVPLSTIIHYPPPSLLSIQCVDRLWFISVVLIRMQRNEQHGDQLANGSRQLKRRL
uniref:Uncharacterized protein n=1 Tax=Angiostrongylus cantonensis TaxID=6313 RepID=A0A0K0CY96_ANGCA